MGFIAFQTPMPRTILRSVRAGIDRFMAEGQPPGKGISEVMDDVMERHPEWNRRMLEQIVNDLED